jgi:4-amino-4-deoxychorismate lyase
MYRFIESICLRDGHFQLLELHEKRMHRALSSVGHSATIQLERLLKQQSKPVTGWWKCRIEYDENGREISFEKYQPRTVSSLRIVKDDTISYSHKFTDRSHLKRLFDLRKDCDDVIICKNDRVTDSYYANLVFKKENKWYAPDSYLLPGVMREKLLNDQTVSLTKVTLSNIHTFEKVKLINALLGFDGPEIEIKNIVF